MRQLLIRSFIAMALGCGSTMASNDAIDEGASPPTSKMVQVFVKLPPDFPTPGQHTITCDVDLAKDTVVSLKNKITEKSGFPLRLQRLSSGVKSMTENDKLLSYYQVIENCTVQVLLQWGR